MSAGKNTKGNDSKIRHFNAGDMVTISITVHHQDGEQKQILTAIQTLSDDGVDVKLSIAQDAQLHVLEFMSTAARSVMESHTSGIICSPADASIKMGIH